MTFDIEVDAFPPEIPFEYPEWCDTEEKRNHFRQWLDLRWIFLKVQRDLADQKRLDEQLRGENNG